MSRKRVFLLCIFLAISAVVDEAASFRNPDVARNVSFLEFTADGDAEEGQAGDQSQGQPSEPIVNTQPLQEIVNEAPNPSDESTGGSAEKGTDHGQVEPTQRGGEEEKPHGGEHDKGSTVSNVSDGNDARDGSNTSLASIGSDGSNTSLASIGSDGNDGNDARDGSNTSLASIGSDGSNASHGSNVSDGSNTSLAISEATSNASHGSNTSLASIGSDGSNASHGSNVSDGSNASHGSNTSISSIGSDGSNASHGSNVSDRSNISDGSNASHGSNARDRSIQSNASSGSEASNDANGKADGTVDNHAEQAPNGQTVEKVGIEKDDTHSESSSTGSNLDTEQLDLYTDTHSDKEEKSAPAVTNTDKTVALGERNASESSAPSEDKASEQNVHREVQVKNGTGSSQETSSTGQLTPVHGEHGKSQDDGKHEQHGHPGEHGQHGQNEQRGEHEDNQIYGTIHPGHKTSLLSQLKEKGIHVSTTERAILEIIESAKKGVKGLLQLQNSKDTGKLLQEALEKLNIRQRNFQNNSFIPLEKYDKILSQIFKILTEMSFYKDGHFYETLGLDKSVLNQSLKEMKIKMLRTIGVSYTKLPPIIKNKQKEGMCAVNDLIISITSRELAQRLAIMFSKWLAAEEYGALVELDKSVELNVLCSGAPILLQQWKYYQNMLGFEVGNEHAFLNLIDELLVIDKRYSNNKKYSKDLKKIKKSKAFNYCTKLMRMAGNISTVPFNHENNKTPSHSITGSLGNLVKAHMGNYYIAIARRVNSYFGYTEKRNKKNSPLKVISVCTLLHLTDMLFSCSDEHLKNILDLNTLKLNILNMQGKRVLHSLVKMNFLSETQNGFLKEICEPNNTLVGETLSKLLNLLSTSSHEVLAAELEKRGFDEDYLQEEVKNINESDKNVRDKGEDEMENMIFEDL
ncbi:hypothetical protein C922_04222 [Plasmodium inui San Antonio 1]|uniref:Rhoptry neck protein 4 n=1 Tax=Plasmodium inui San Antonio 1 TaxID=1237626 RepID=W6ZXF1_9APIC|nr:hypothetical protein C922_04222 [Plasmodium inui San Antonio 1]EUD65482.1 hypothetical protein C922_04222 [Plasmodium inui San Antonio 1]